jgi:hypothetical protein
MVLLRAGLTSSDEFVGTILAHASVGKTEA